MPAASAQGSQKHVKAGRLDALFAFHHHQSFNSHGKTDTGQGGTAKVLNQAVIATAGGNGILGTELVGDHFESGFGVIVETAHHAGVDGVVRCSGF